MGTGIVGVHLHVHGRSLAAAAAAFFHLLLEATGVAVDDLLRGTVHHVLAPTLGASGILVLRRIARTVTFGTVTFLGRLAESHKHCHYFHSDPEVLHVILVSKGDCAVQEGPQRAFSDEGIPLGATALVLRVGGVLARRVVSQAQVPEGADNRSHVIVRGKPTVLGGFTALLFLHENEVLQSLHLLGGARVLAAPATLDANVLDDVAPGEQRLDVGCPVRDEAPQGLDTVPDFSHVEVSTTAVLCVPCLMVATANQSIPHESREVVRRRGDDDLGVLPTGEVLVPGQTEGPHDLGGQRDAVVRVGRSPLTEGSSELACRPLVLVVEVLPPAGDGAHTSTQHTVDGALVGCTVLGSREPGFVCFVRARGHWVLLELVDSLRGDF